MSEFQYYQFIAVDRPLAPEQLAGVRALTTRATLTPTSFVNSYQWGDFKGDPEDLVGQYYDGHLYFANWGTRRLILRWPAEHLPLKTAETYCTGASASVHVRQDQVLVTMDSDDEDGEFDDFNDLFDLSDCDNTAEDQWLPSIIRAREDVAAGDLRFLYLAWLLCVQNGDLPDTAVEPPLPAGLSDLPESLQDLAFFLRIDQDLIAAAATRSPKLPPDPTLEHCRSWVARQPTAFKDTLITQILAGENLAATATLRRHFRTEVERPPSASTRRTVAQLLGAVPAQTAVRRAAEERERTARREAKEANMRAVQEGRLSKLEKDPEAAWRHIRALMDSRLPRHYPKVVQTLRDLAVLAKREGTPTQFAERVHSFRIQHRTKKALLHQLADADL